MKPDWLFGSAFLLVGLGFFGSVGREPPWTWWLVWPGISFLIVAVAYLRVSSRPFGKRSDGARSAIATGLLLPYLALARTVWELQTRLWREAPWNAIGESLIVARRLRASEFPDRAAAILDLTAELCDPDRIRRHPGYRCLPILDANGIDPVVLVRSVLRIPPSSYGRILIHCANGHGRAALVSAAWLLAHGFAGSSADALGQLRAARPAIFLRRRQRWILDQAETILRRLEAYGDAVRRRLALCLGAAVAGQAFETGILLLDSDSMIGPILKAGGHAGVPGRFSALVENEFGTAIPDEWLTSCKKDASLSVRGFLDACVPFLDADSNSRLARRECAGDHRG